MSSPIPVTKPLLGQAECNAIKSVIQSAWVAQGPKVAEFEELFAQTIGAKYAVAVSSCTTALHLALLVLDIGTGDGVICPSFSFIATANVIRYCRARPVFGDIDSRTYNLSPDDVEYLLKHHKKIKAILVVDQVGLPADWEHFLHLSKKYGIALIEDAACAVGSEYRLDGKWKKIGSFGDLCCFSFHGRKVLTTGEGGMITTSHKIFANRLRRLRHHGMSISDFDRHQSDKIIFESYPELGFNYRMSDIQAAIGIAQLSRLNRILAKRRKLADHYTQAFQRQSALVPPFVPSNTRPNFQSYLLRLSEKAKLSRNQLMTQLLKRGIHTRRGIMAIHRELCYADYQARLPETEKASDSTVILPLYPAMSGREINYVISNILEILQ